MFFACQVTACTLHLIFWDCESFIVHHYCANQLVVFGYIAGVVPMQCAGLVNQPQDYGVAEWRLLALLCPAPSSLSTGLMFHQGYKHFQDPGLPYTPTA